MNVTTGLTTPQPARAERVVTSPPVATPSVSQPKGPSTLGKFFKGVLRVVVPIASVVATYFLTNKVFGPLLTAQFGDAARQVVPMVVSMAIGGVARQITK